MQNLKIPEIFTNRNVNLDLELLKIIMRAVDRRRDEGYICNHNTSLRHE